MPQFPIYRQQYQVGTRRASEADLGGVGQAQEKLVTEVSGMVAKLKKKEEDDALLAAQTRNAEMGIELLKGYNDLLTTARPDGAGFADSVQAMVFERYAKAIEETGNEKARKWLQLQQARAVEQYVSKGIQVQGVLRGKHVALQYSSAQDARMNLLVADPLQYDKVLEDERTHISTLDIPQAVKQQMMAEARVSAGKFTAMGMIQNASSSADAEEVVKALESETWRKRIDSADYTRLLSSAKQNVKFWQRQEADALSKRLNEDYADAYLDATEMMIRMASGDIPSPGERAAFRERHNTLRQHGDMRVESMFRGMSVTAEQMRARRSQVQADIDAQFKMVNDVLTGKAPAQVTKDMEKAVDTWYSVLTQTPKWNKLPVDQREAQTLYFVSKLGVVPTQLRDQIRGNLYSPDPTLQVEGARMVTSLQRFAPTFPVLREFTEDQVTMATRIQSFHERGFTPEQIKERMKAIGEVAPQVRDAREKAMSGGKYFSAEDHVKHLKSLLDVSESDIPPALLGMHRDIMTNEFILTGDIESAKALADVQIKRAGWAPSVFNGGKWTYMAPEVVAGVKGMDNEQWMRRDLVAEISKHFVRNPDLFGKADTPDSDGVFRLFAERNIPRETRAKMEDLATNWKAYSMEERVAKIDKIADDIGDRFVAYYNPYQSTDGKRRYTIAFKRDDNVVIPLGVTTMRWDIKDSTQSYFIEQEAKKAARDDALTRMEKEVERVRRERLRATRVYRGPGQVDTPNAD